MYWRRCASTKVPCNVLSQWHVCGFSKAQYAEKKNHEKMPAQRIRKRIYTRCMVYPVTQLLSIALLLLLLSFRQNCKRIECATSIFDRTCLLRVRKTHNKNLFYRRALSLFVCLLITFCRYTFLANFDWLCSRIRCSY